MINILRHLLIPFNFFLHFVKTISFCGNISILKIVRRFKLHIQRNVFQRGTSLRSKQMLSSHFIILNVINSTIPNLAWCLYCDLRNSQTEHEVAVNGTQIKTSYPVILNGLKKVFHFDFILHPLTRWFHHPLLYFYLIQDSEQTSISQLVQDWSIF